MTEPTTAEALAGLSGPASATLWSVLVDRHAADAWRLIASRLHDPHQAEDAYQEFWLRVPEAATRFRPQGPDPERAARAWLMHLAYATAIDHHRRRPRPAQPLEDGMIAAPEPEARDDSGRLALAERVRAAVEALPEQHRRPLLLHLVAGVSYQDLAAELRCTVNNARVKVHRALALLRAELGPAGAGLGEASLGALLVPPALLLPPPPPPLPAVPVLPPPVAAAGVLAKAPLLAGLGVAAAGAATATVLVLSPSTSPETAVHPTALAATAAAVLSAPIAAAVIDDFERSEHGCIASGDQVFAVPSLVDAPAGLGAGKALKVAWPSPHGRWVDVHIAKRTPIAAINPAGAVITCAVWAEAFSGVEGLGLRLADSKGESFQWSATLPRPDQSGWRTVTFTVDPARHNGHWSGNNDGVIDYPLAFNGFAVGLRADAPSGAVIIDNVALQEAK